MAIQLPESVKIEKIGDVQAGASIMQSRIDWGLGRHHVAILLAIRVVLDAYAVAPDSWTWALYRKSEGAPADLTMPTLANLTDIIVSGGCNKLSDTGWTSKVEDFVFPYPIVLIRPSQFLFLGSVGLSYGAYMYYITQTVQDEVLAKLMVKDHG